MPVLLFILFYLIIIAFLVVIAYLFVITASFIAAYIAAWINAITIGSAAKFDTTETESLYVWFYGVAGFLFALMNTTAYGSSEGGGGFFTFMLVWFFWPFCTLFMNFNDPDGAWGLKISVMISTFVIVQLIAVIMVLKRAKNLTRK